MTSFHHRRDMFVLPEGVIYLDGNSLGPLPKAAMARVGATLSDEWGKDLIKAWNTADWIEKPRTIGDRIAPLIGAEEGSVIVGDTLSIKIYQALAAALEMRPDRKVILSDNGNFPTDLYMAEGLVRTLGQGHIIETPAPEEVESRINEDVAVLMLTHVDYRTARMHDMARLTAKAREFGVITVWDLAHSAGAVPVDLQAVGADFAAGCTYKYLNGGPGAPAFIYVSPRHADRVTPALSGWLGHESPFAFDLDYAPARGADRMRVGTPPIIAMAVLEAALDAWDGVDVTMLKRQSDELSTHFINRIETECPGLELVSPRSPNDRGSHISFAAENGYPIMQALIARGVIGDFRAPDMIRFGFAPLYNTLEEIDRAASILCDIVKTQSWDRPDYHHRSTVT